MSGESNFGNKILKGGNSTKTNPRTSQGRRNPKIAKKVLGKSASVRHGYLSVKNGKAAGTNIVESKLLPQKRQSLLPQKRTSGVRLTDCDSRYQLRTAVKTELPPADKKRRLSPNFGNSEKLVAKNEACKSQDKNVSDSSREDNGEGNDGSAIEGDLQNRLFQALSLVPRASTVQKLSTGINPVLRRSRRQLARVHRLRSMCGKRDKQPVSTSAKKVKKSVKEMPRKKVEIVAKATVAEKAAVARQAASGEKLTSGGTSSTETAAAVAKETSAGKVVGVGKPAVRMMEPVDDDTLKCIGCGQLLRTVREIAGHTCG